MPDDDTLALIHRFTEAACRGPGTALGALFTEDGAYHDGYYGAFTGREAIARMIDDHFHAHASALDWRFRDVVREGDLAYGIYRFHYDSRLPGTEGRRIAMDGMGRFRIRGQLIADYREMFDTGVGMAQLGFPAERMARSLEKRARRVREHPTL